jgi:hypothetical protein
MKHHLVDLMEGDRDYWTVAPNRERYKHQIDEIAEGDPDVEIVTLGRHDKHWERVFTFPRLVELTLQEPSQKQLSAISALKTVRRLRVTHARPKSIECIAALQDLEELVLEYVSGFDDLSPLRGLRKLRALHLENLRRVSDFGGLAGLESLRYLAIFGTTDREQPLVDFHFLSRLPRLEVLRLTWFRCKAPFPAMLPASELRSLKRLHLRPDFLDASEYALLEEALPGVQGAQWGPYHEWAHGVVELPPNDPRAALAIPLLRERHPEVSVRIDGTRWIADPNQIWFTFTGRGAGRVKRGSASAEAKCREKAAAYAALKAKARELLQRRAGAE